MTKISNKDIITWVVYFAIVIFCVFMGIIIVNNTINGLNDNKKQTANTVKKDKATAPEVGHRRVNRK